jgi:magnesium-transporting ATPase (P-type)
LNFRLGVNFLGDDVRENKIYRKVAYDNVYEQCEKTYEILHTLAFDSNRGRMSVIVKDVQRDEIVLYCKGCQSSVFIRAVKEKSFDYSTVRSWSSSQNDGCRELAVAYKILDPYEYGKCANLLHSIDDSLAMIREEKLAIAYELIEAFLTVLGITVNEEVLQEEVDTTLKELRQAGIKVWIVSGDKAETCVNILEPCGYFTNGAVQFILQDELLDQELIGEKLADFQQK